MAKINIVSGKLSGKIGQFVGSTWKGITTLRAYTKPSNPKTAGQVAQRTKWAIVTKLASEFNAVLKKYSPTLNGLTPFNVFCKLNCSAVIDDKIQFSKLSLFQGSSDMGITYALKENADGAVEGFTVRAGSANKVLFIIYDHATKSISSAYGAVSAAEDTTLMLPKPVAKGTDKHLYVVGLLGDTASATQYANLAD